MLTKELAIAEYDFERARILPDRLTRRSHARYARYADQAVAAYQDGAGRTRRELHRTVHELFHREHDCPARRIDAFCKLLDDASVYDRDRHGQAADLRRQVFQLAAHRHPLVARADRLFESEEAVVKAEIAGRLGTSWPDIERQLFADVMEFHRLKRLDGLTSGTALLSRYNVAQVQAALYGAVSLTIHAREDFKTILRFAKLARLMHDVTRDPRGGYWLRFNGPASVLRGTRRYGVAMARFLPAVIACRGWKLHAAIPARQGNWTWNLELSAEDGLRSHLPPPDEFDSEVERLFAERWGTDPREGWTLERESEILHAGQKAFIPDFVFRHEDGRAALLEIVGFWTPEYLRAKAETLGTFRGQRILLAVSQQAHARLPELNSLGLNAQAMITYKTRLKVDAVLALLRREGAGPAPEDALPDAPLPDAPTPLREGWS
jgi:predicted nuclease of restriction endonuclease-like RecB superfamily